MTNKHSSFSSEVKKEIINNLSKNHEIISFIKGLLFCSANIDKNGNYLLYIKNEYLYDKIVRKLDKSKISYISDPKHPTKLVIVYNELIIPQMESKDDLSYFFGGVFCGGGSISGKNSTSYHLEISSHNKQNIEEIASKLNEYDFGFNILNRNNKYVLYTKNKDKLIDFLAAIGAKKSWYSLQNLIIKRDFENVTNRINNIDLSNLNKIAESTIKHIENINYMFENNLDELFDEDQLVAFRIKTENKWISLAELSYILGNDYNIFISKSGLNHWFRKLNTVVEKHKNNQ
ncbi:DNA-binding protein WhiA [Mycoplasma seminis]|uniref:Probable cell division protein WhiA n=1 Tax=Mycoplasma seminis TaxID=512749 RepID=A0ABY9HB01_9MOLU|nr:DNA-binding protein WhiA [Mycoplasma seminis]WLP85765.1 DNA-binding protein WhiA [Mycoplasma seminis]